MASPSIDLECVYDRFLIDEDWYRSLGGVLAEWAPEWCGRTQIYQTSRDRRAIDLAMGDAFRDAVLEAAGERGQLYAELVARYGAGDERLSGSVEIRGASPALTVIVSVDQRPVSPMGKATRLGNGLTLQLRRARIEGHPADQWAFAVLDALAAATGPMWGCVRSGEEYRAKVMSDEPGVSRAIGRDFGRYLPGLFTGNFFGGPYVDLMGKRRMLGAPADHVDELQTGVLIRIGETTRDWDTPEQRATERRVIAHLGHEYFFSKAGENKHPAAPDWSVLVAPGNHTA